MMRCLFKKATLFLTGFLLMMSVCTHPIFYNVTMLRHKETRQLVFLLSDIHIDKNDMYDTLTQREDLVSIMKGLKARGEPIQLLVEDNASPRCETDDLNVLHEQSWKQIFLGYSEQLPQWTDAERVCSPMSLLEKQLLWEGISAKNVDNRRPVERDANGVLREVDQERRLDYFVEAYNNLHNTIENDAIKEKLLQFIDTYSERDLDAGFFMVDVATIDAIYQQMHIQTIFVCAGGRHNEKIIEFLLSTGDYEQVMSAGDDFYQHTRKIYAAVDAGGLAPLCPLDLNQTFAQAQHAIDACELKQI